MVRLVKHSLDHPRAYLTAAALVTVLLGAGLTRLELRTDGQSLRPAGAEVVLRTERDQARFHDPRQAIVLISTRDVGPSVASPQGLRFLARVHRELRGVAGVRGEAILSLASVPSPVGDRAGFTLTNQLDEIPADDAGVAALVARLRRLPWIEGLLLSADGRHGALYVPLDEHGSVGERVGALQTWAESLEGAPFEVLITGPEVAESALGTMVLRDLVVLVPVMLVVIAAVLWATLRTAGGVVVPLLESLLALVWTFGAMGWAGIPVTLVSTILPVVLMAMAITDELHLLERVQFHIGRSGGASAQVRARRSRDAAGGRGRGVSDRRADRVLVHAALYRSYAEIDRAVLAAGATTALGFLSFLSATLPPMRDFGAASSFGIAAAMLLTYAWVPAMTVVLPISWVRRPRPRRDPAPASRAAWVAKRPYLALAVGCVALAAAVPGVQRLRVQDAWIENFAPDTPLVRADRAMNAAFWGTYRFDVVLEGDDGFFFDPKGLALLRDVEQAVADAPHTGGSLSVGALYGEIADAMGIGSVRGSAGATDPSGLSADAIADISALADMSGNRFLVRQLVTEDGSAARVRLFVRNADYIRAAELRDFLDARVPALASRYRARWSYSGDLPVALHVVGAIVGDQIRSISWSTVAVAAALATFFVGLRGAIVAIVPVVAGVVAVFGVMGYAGWPLGIASSMFASLGVGVGVDFGVHVLHRYDMLRYLGHDHARALEETFATAGRALLWNMLVLALGLSVLVLSQVRPNHSLGVLLAGAMAACYAATYLLLPALLRGLKPAAVTAGATVLLLLAAPMVRGEEAATGRGGGAASARGEAAAAARGGEARTGGGADVAKPSPCAAPVSTAATDWMKRIEGDVRSRPRVVRTEIETTYEAGHPLAKVDTSAATHKTLWAAFDGDAALTHILYVFSAPGRLAGTSLLIHDAADPATPDRKWLYLRSFTRFTELLAGSERVVVPGTPLTYDDARAFLPGDRYEFRSSAEIAAPAGAAGGAIPGDEAGEANSADAASGARPGGNAADEKPTAKADVAASPASAPPSGVSASANATVTFVACPSTSAFSEATGYAFVEVVIDRARRIVRRLVYHDLSGRPFKAYEAAEEIEKAGAWWPTLVRLRHLDDRYVATMRSEHWTSPARLGVEFFAADADRETFLVRFQRLLAPLGLADRLGAEIAESERVIREHDERFKGEAK
ncbi:MAG: MMPL family transporter [Deltaproteobacteria bacterium]|nr:MMPL family transporter [Deltaproteobacteria bacterium]